MKKFLSIATVFLLIFSLAACSNREDTETSDDNVDTQSADIIMVEDGEWPENEYTEGLPIPAGTVEWVKHDSEGKSYSINIVDIGEEEYEEYMQLLEKQGYSEIESVSEEIKGEDYISTGTILSNGEKSLSIAYADGNFGIYIVNEGI